jgi:uncharacterized protein YabE (DUF348 family)
MRGFSLAQGGRRTVSRGFYIRHRGSSELNSGLYLSVLTVDLVSLMSGGKAGRVQLSHLSVHDGSTVLSTPLDHIDRMASPDSWEALRRKNEFWDLEWTLSNSVWPAVPVR